MVNYSVKPLSVPGGQGAPLSDSVLYRRVPTGITREMGARSSAAAALALVLALGLLAAAAEGDPAGGAADGAEGQAEEDEDDIIAIQVLSGAGERAARRQARAQARAGC